MKRSLKNIFVLLTVIVSSTANGTFAQGQSTIVLGDLILTTRNVQDENELVPLPESDPKYVEPRVEVTIEFSISNPEDLKSVEINFETTKGNKDFKSFLLNYVKADGKDYLTIRNKYYEIVNSKVTLTERIPAKVLKRKIYFSIKALDKEQRPSNILTKEFN